MAAFNRLFFDITYTRNRTDNSGITCNEKTMVNPLAEWAQLAIYLIAIDLASQVKRLSFVRKKSHLSQHEALQPLVKLSGSL